MFRTGDLVEVYIPASAYRDSDVIARLARRYNNELHYISRHKAFRDDRDVVIGVYYELEDVTTAEGMPLAFDREWVRDPED